MTGEVQPFGRISLEGLGGGGPIVVLAPHPDDESLGCGALLGAAFASGPVHRAHVVCLTDGGGSHPGSREWPPARLAARRREELVEAVRVLGGGPTDVSFLDHPDGWLGAADLDAVAASVAGICQRLCASAVFATSPADHHADHKSAAEVARRVHALLPRLRLWFYPVWSRWDDPAFASALAPAVPVSFDGGSWTDAKRRAIHAHSSQLGQVVRDDPDGFVLPPAMVGKFVDEPEIFIEAAACP